MARITRVAHAQQRYERVPVLDGDGQPKITVTSRTARRSGQQVTIRVTMADKSKPLDPESCELCQAVIEPGMPYKWIKPKSGPYGGHRRIRCANCPDWQVWDYSQSLSAQLARVSHDFWAAIADAGSEDDVRDALENAAGEIDDLATEKRDSAQNIEEGFGHSTSQSEELADIAGQLETWAGEIRDADIPDYPEAEDAECEDCGGSGQMFEDSSAEDNPCPACKGSGHPDEPTEDQLDDWRTELESDLSIVDESPV